VLSSFTLVSKHQSAYHFIAKKSLNSLICCLHLYYEKKKVLSRVAPDFGSGKSEIRPFFGNPAKYCSGQISSRIWQMPVQLHYVQLILDKTNADDLSSSMFTILFTVSWTIKMQIRYCSTNFVKNWQAVT